MKCAFCGAQQVGPRFECGGEGDGVCVARGAVDDFVAESDGDTPRTRARRARSMRPSEDFPLAAIAAIRALSEPDASSIDLALRVVAATLGGGFHLDNRASEYCPELDGAWCAVVDRVVEATFAVCAREGVDPYARALAAMRDVGAIDETPADAGILAALDDDAPTEQDFSDPDFVLGAVLAQVEDLSRDDALRVLREAISAVEARAST